MDAKLPGQETKSQKTTSYKQAKSETSRWSKISGFFRWQRLVDKWLRRPILSSENESIGARGERLAAEFLKKRGMKIVAAGHRTKLSEIDLIATDHGTVVFVEVKTWQRGGQGGPADAVDAAKQERLTRAALVYLKKKGLLKTPARFDVVEVILEGIAPSIGTPSKSVGPIPSIRHYANAFEATGNFQLYS